MASKGSDVSHTRGLTALMLVKKRRIKSPLVGRVGKLSTCSRSLRFLVGKSRPSSSSGRKLAKSTRHLSMYRGRKARRKSRALCEYDRITARSPSGSFTAPLSNPVTLSEAGRYAMFLWCRLDESSLERSTLRSSSEKGNGVRGKYKTLPRSSAR